MRIVIVAIVLFSAGGIAFAWLTRGPSSLRAEYQRDVARALALSTVTERISEADLGHLPSQVQRYIRISGFVGQAKVHNVRARMHGRIRSGPESRWMPLAAEQHNTLAVPRARLFYMTASMFGIPAYGYHRYVGASARMTVKAAGLVQVANASGPEMDQSETVTLFNDICMLAPGALIDPQIAWEPIDERSVAATFTNAGHTIRATLRFNDAGELIDFESDDRYQASSDGQTMRRVHWSTPLGGYRTFGAFRLASGGQARWHESNGSYTYIELAFDDVQFNVAGR